MVAKFLTYILCLLALTKVDGIEVNSEGKIHIKIVTTASSGDTGRFIRNQLAPAYALYSEFLDIDFVPWGRTTWPEGEKISCRHGLTECWANRLHKCVLNVLKENPDAQMKYMLCEFTTPFPSYVSGSYECVRASGLRLIDIDFCVANNHDDLDRAAKEAAEVTAEFDYVPAIVFNGVISREKNDEAERRLTSMVCFALANDPNSGITNCRIHM